MEYTFFKGISLYRKLIANKCCVHRELSEFLIQHGCDQKPMLPLRSCEGGSCLRQSKTDLRSFTTPAVSVTWDSPQAHFVYQQVSHAATRQQHKSTHHLFKASSDWPPLVWRHERSAQKRAQAASTAPLQLLESPAKPSPLLAGDPGNTRGGTRRTGELSGPFGFTSVYFIIIWPLNVWKNDVTQVTLHRTSRLLLHRLINSSASMP